MNITPYLHINPIHDIKKIVSILSQNKYLEISLSGLGILITVAVMWPPFGWKTTDLTHGRQNFPLMSSLTGLISFATLTVLFADGTQAKFPITSRVSTEWFMCKIQFTAKKDFTGLVLTFQPDIHKEEIWLDDVRLSRNTMDIAILNRDFEQ